QSRAEPGTRATDSLGDRAHLPVPAGEQCDDPIGLTQLVHPQHNTGIAVKTHEPSVSPPRSPLLAQYAGYVGTLENATIMRMMPRIQLAAPTSVAIRHIVLVVFEASRAICRFPCIL